MKHVVVFAVGLALMTVPMAMAQETTGGLHGSVTTEVGTPIAGAVVEASGPLGAVTSTSNAEGRYRFPRLVPGTYTIGASVEGFLPVEADQVRVILGEAVTVDITLPQAAFEDEILVYSDTVTIDFTESATATNIRQWEIEGLPHGRDFTDVVTFAAGAVFDNQGGGIMIDGASGLENRYVIDGADSTSLLLGRSAVPMRAEFMEEVQVKSAGYMAEYGGASCGQEIGSVRYPRRIAGPEPDTVRSAEFDGPCLHFHWRPRPRDGTSRDGGPPARHPAVFHRRVLSGRPTA